jgi:hypothetical protein
MPSIRDSCPELVPYNTRRTRGREVRPDKRRFPAFLQIVEKMTFERRQLLSKVDGLDADKFGSLTQLLFDAQQLVVFGDAVGARG